MTVIQQVRRQPPNCRYSCVEYQLKDGEFRSPFVLHFRRPNRPFFDRYTVVSTTAGSTIIIVRFLIRWNLLQYVDSLWRCRTLRSRRWRLTPRCDISRRGGYRCTWRSCNSIFHRRFRDSGCRVRFGGERIFLRLSVSIFGCWIRIQVLGAIKICTEKKKIDRRNKQESRCTHHRRGQRRAQT